MPAVLRFLLYVFAAAVGLLAGRYVLPAPRSILAPNQDAAVLAKARQQYWQTKFTDTLTGAQEPAARMARGVTLLEQVQSAEFPAVLQAVAEDQPLLALVSASWAQADPAGFFQYLAAQLQPQEREMKLAAILLTQWAQTDLRAAEAAASRLRVPGLAPDPLTAVALTQLRADARAGLAYLTERHLTLPDTLLLRELDAANPAAPSWRGLSLPARLDFLATLPPSPWRDVAQGQIMASYLQQNPAAILTAAQSTGQSMNLAAPAATAWLGKNAAAAQQYFSTEAHGQVRAVLGLAIVKHLASQDAQAAWDFALTSLSGATRVAAQEHLIQQLTAADPATAWAWIKDRAEAPWRNRALAKLRTAWPAHNPAQAQEWWSTLTPAEQQAAAH